MLLTGIVPTGTIGEDVIARKALSNRFSNGPSAIPIVGEWVVPRISKVSSTGKENTFRGNGLVGHIDRPRDVDCTQAVLLFACSAIIKALNSQRQVLLSQNKLTVELALSVVHTTGRKVGLIPSPCVDHVFVLICTWGCGHRACEDTIVIVIGKDCVARTTPTFIRTRSVNGLVSSQVRVGHVHLERDRVFRYRRRARPVCCTLTKASVDRSGLCDVAQQSVVVLPVCAILTFNVLFTIPTTSCTSIGEGVIARKSNWNGIRQRPSSVSIVRHGIVARASKEGSTCQAHAVCGYRLVLHVHRKRHIDCLVRRRARAGSVIPEIKIVVVHIPTRTVG